jgi:nitroreductase
VELDVLKECLQIAQQAPSGSNSQGWQFLLVTERDKIERIAECYRSAFADYEAGPAQPTRLHTDDPSMAQTQERVLNSAQYLAANMHKVPALLIPCMEGRPDSGDLPLGTIAGMYGSVIPATWSFMLAARERGLGTCWTTLHLNFEKEIAELLQIPDHFSQVALIPIAYTRGTHFQEAPRKDLNNSLHINGW